MTEIGNARAGNEPHISRADHCNAHRFCSSAGHCRAPATAPIISAPSWSTMRKCYSLRNRHSPDERRSGENFCVFPAFWQDRLAARMTAVTPSA